MSFAQRLCIVGKNGCDVQNACLPGLTQHQIGFVQVDQSQPFGHFQVVTHGNVHILLQPHVVGNQMGINVNAGQSFDRIEVQNIHEQ